jgi:hypothetical protein
MSTFPSPTVLGAACLLFLLSQCAGPPPAPGDKDYHGRKQTNAYREGYHHGFMDGSRKLDPNFERYHDEYLPATQQTFAIGYQKGYDAGRPSAPATPADEERAFQNGHEAGQTDARNGLQPNHQRYRNQFSTGTEGAFHQGYVKGYEEARRE